MVDLEGKAFRISEEGSVETRQLDALRPGEEGVVVRVDAPRGLRHRLVEMGLVPGTTVAVAGAAPLGDPIEIALRGYRLAIRRSEAARVTLTAVGPVREPEPVVPLRVGGGEGPGADGPRRRRRWRRPHIYGPGMRRRTPARCHGAATARPAGPAGITVALAGNPNTGKSSLFNALTGGRQHVGNWPGKTVTRAEGVRRVGEVTIKFVDLPGTYSLRSASPEEEAAEEFLTSGGPDVVVAVVDSTNLERNLFLVLELAELGLPMVVAANMSDVAWRQAAPPATATLARDLDMPVVATVGRTGAGVDDLVEAVLHQAGVIVR
jgi:ferrous iron transport protein B